MILLGERFDTIIIFEQNISFFIYIKKKYFNLARTVLARSVLARSVLARSKNPIKKTVCIVIKTTNGFFEFLTLN